MKLYGYLTVKKPERIYSGGAAKWTKNKPALASNEIAIKIEATIPDELFTKPQLKFQLDIPKESVPQKEITAEVVGNIQELIQQNLGIEVKLIASKPEEEEFLPIN